MAYDLLFRTEDINQSDVLDLFVETDDDRQVVVALKSRTPVILRGSRGVGKSFLLRVAEAELRRDFTSDQVLPVYLTFNRASLIKNPSGERFLEWMTAKICNRVRRVVSMMGLSLPPNTAVQEIIGTSPSGEPSKLDRLEDQIENSWRASQSADDELAAPAPELLQDAIEEFCLVSGVGRVVLLIDEAAHVFLPEQQRQFFTLMRDLRSPYIAVKAAVYPGTTSYGETFQPTHDATTLSIDRQVTSGRYAMDMRQIVLRQGPDLERSISTHGEVFDALAFAATGNPRILLKTIARTDPFNLKGAQDLIRTYYRDEIWAEHSSLGERYPGHRALIDWGRKFMEESVLPGLHQRNRYGDERATSSYLWIHRDAPQAVKEALRLLCYSGILQEGEPGVRGTRSQPGTRYMVNLGCQFAIDPDPVRYGTSVRRSLSVRRMTEYGAHHPDFRSIQDFSLNEEDIPSNIALDRRLQTSIDMLDVTPFQMKSLRALKFDTIGEVLESAEDEFKKARYVGDVRARQIRNAAVAAVLEYLSG